jgi:putative FmdB family regulatory protein
VPIYEYQCQSCDHALERLQKITEEPLVDCPACDQPSLRKMVSAAAFRLKGNGWYETDFKKDNKRNLADGSGKDGSDTKPATKGNGKTAPPPAAGSSAKSESKPAAKTAATP